MLSVFWIDPERYNFRFLHNLLYLYNSTSLIKKERRKKNTLKYFDCPFYVSKGVSRRSFCEVSNFPVY